ncbi:MAG: low affinity iron permease family protein [Rudaea sp.]
MKRSWFTRFANSSARFAGKPATFMLALTIIVVWGISGPIFHYSDTWQLVINTGTTIITFMMVFLIQNTQNRDGYALQVKLDELIRALAGAHNALLDLEELDDVTLEAIRKRYTKLADKARREIRDGKPDIGCDELEDDLDGQENSTPKQRDNGDD